MHEFGQYDEYLEAEIILIRFAMVFSIKFNIFNRVAAGFAGWFLKYTQHKVLCMRVLQPHLILAQRSIFIVAAMSSVHAISNMQAGARRIIQCDVFSLY